MRRLIGRCVIDGSTKRIVGRLRRGDVAVIAHKDLDDVAAQALAARRPRAVLNTQPSYTGRYPARGPGILVSRGIPLIDCLRGPGLSSLGEGKVLSIEGPDIFLDGRLVAQGRRVTTAVVQSELAAAQRGLGSECDRFIDNTLAHLVAEKRSFLRDIAPPPLVTPLAGRTVLVCIRGRWYQEDLRSLRGFIRDERPALIGVDGGADALASVGFTPDIIVGDMDSVSDRTLMRTRDIVVHAYRNGHAPGLGRVRRLGLTAGVFPCPGTSEDAAMLLAFFSGAELIVGVGAHRGLFDFLDKGRQGMSSTLLARMVIGSALVDATGVGRLHRSRLRWSDVAVVAGAGLLPLLALSSQLTITSLMVRALLLRARMILGW